MVLTYNGSASEHGRAPHWEIFSDVEILTLGHKFATFPKSKRDVGAGSIDVPLPVWDREQSSDLLDLAARGLGGLSRNQALWEAGVIQPKKVDSAAINSAGLDRDTD